MSPSKRANIQKMGHNGSKKGVVGVNVWVCVWGCTDAPHVYAAGAFFLARNAFSSRAQGFV